MSGNRLFSPGVLLRNLDTGRITELIINITAPDTMPGGILEYHAERFQYTDFSGALQVCFPNVLKEETTV